MIFTQHDIPINNAVVLCVYVRYCCSPGCVQQDPFDFRHADRDVQPECMQNLSCFLCSTFCIILLHPSPTLMQRHGWTEGAKCASWVHGLLQILLHTRHGRFDASNDQNQPGKVAELMFALDP